jgi:hypothetical protein
MEDLLKAASDRSVKRLINLKRLGRIKAEALKD